MVGLAAAAALLLVLGGTVYRISTDRGELVINCHDAAVEVTIKRNGKPVVEGLEVSHGQAKTTVRSGDIEVLISGDHGGAFELTGVDLDKIPKVSDAGLAVFKDCKNLTSLHLGGTQVRDAGLADLAGLPSLTKLFLARTRISLPGHEQLKTALPKCNITWSEPNRSVAASVLFLGGTVEIGTTGQPASRPIQNSVDLPCDYFQVRRGSLAGIAKPLDKLPEQMSWLRIPEFDRLESIDLSGITGLDYGFLVPIHGLRELTLANAGLNDAAVANLPKLPALQRLVLDGNDIRGPGLAHLSGRPELIDRSLGHPNLTDLCAKNLAELKQLKRLSLAGSGLSDAGIKHLAGLTNLEALDLRRTKASATGIDRLRQALPACRIESDHGTFEPTAPPDPDRRGLSEGVPAGDA